MSYTRPRLVIDIDQEDYDKLHKIMEHGEYKRLFGAIVKDLLAAYDLAYHFDRNQMILIVSYDILRKTRQKRLSIQQ